MDWKEKQVRMDWRGQKTGWIGKDRRIKENREWIGKDRRMEQMRIEKGLERIEKWTRIEDGLERRTDGKCLTQLRG